MYGSLFPSPYTALFNTCTLLQMDTILAVIDFVITTS